MDDEYENEDDYDPFASSEEAPIDAIRAALFATKGEVAPFKTADRADFDRREHDQPLPEGWSASPIDLGRPAARLSGPGARPNRTILYLHGGGFCLGSIPSHAGLVATLAHASDAEGLLLDYRLAPEHPFPAGLDDAYEAYRRLLTDGRDPSALVIAGDSAGAALAIGVCVKARDAGLAMPLAIIALCPWSDLTQSGQSMVTRADTDPTISKAKLDDFAALYLGGADPRDPLASPSFADLTGLPVMLIHVGGDEVLLSDAEALKDRARAAGVDANLEIWPGLFHVWHRFYAKADEARDALNEVGAWLKRRWKA
jgi:acetyl esterase/lipase